MASALNTRLGLAKVITKDKFEIPWKLSSSIVICNLHNLLIGVQETIEIFYNRQFSILIMRDDSSEQLALNINTQTTR